MSGNCVDKLNHDCGGKNKTLQVFAHPETGKVDGFCFRCNTYVANPYGKPMTVDDVELPEVPTEAEIQAKLAEIDSYQTLDLRHRKLRKQTLEKFGWKVAVSEQDGKTPSAYYIPTEKNGKITGYAAKTIGENPVKWFIGDTKDIAPYGWDKAIKSGSHRLIITEGPEDMLAVDRIYEMYGDKEWHPAVISVTSGVNSGKQLAKYANEMRRHFKEIVLCLDNDEVGKKFLKECMILFGDAVSVELPFKDANECLMKGVAQQAYKALAYKKEVPSNSKLVWGTSLVESSAEPPRWGELTWPWPKMQDLTRGIRLGETIYIGAGVKMGKSEILNALAAHFILEDKVKVFMAKPEEANNKTMKLLSGKAAGKVFHDPKIPFNRDEYIAAAQSIANSVAMVDLYQHVGWESLVPTIKAAAYEGCKAVFIDPITNLTNGMESAEANVKLQAIAQQAAQIAMDLNIVVFLFCHLKAPQGILMDDKRQRYYDQGKYTGFNCPHEKGGEVLSAQFAGSRAMMRSAHYMIGLEGNKDENLEPHIRNTRHLRILEDREYGEIGTVPIFWDKNTSLFREL